jgi:hypothetical protein
MGVAVNGVSIFNQYAAMYSPLTNEANGFDQYGGHPQQQGVYHYHVEPTYITANKGKDALIGFLLDGFPVYGPLEGTKTITNADLDVYHGHTRLLPIILQVYITTISLLPTLTLTEMDFMERRAQFRNNIGIAGFPAAVVALFGSTYRLRITTSIWVSRRK